MGCSVWSPSERVQRIDISRLCFDTDGDNGCTAVSGTLGVISGPAKAVNRFHVHTAPIMRSCSSVPLTIQYIDPLTVGRPS